MTPGDIAELQAVLNTAFSQWIAEKSKPNPHYVVGYSAQDSVELKKEESKEEDKPVCLITIPQGYRFKLWREGIPHTRIVYKKVNNTPIRVINKKGISRPCVPCWTMAMDFATSETHYIDQEALVVPVQE